ncbi:MMPL family transporter [Nocardioides speluncae]|uniref:MMPL family transporter n=1 Tax=Nocardioides speluncae TaxID=2670337 RepID=UPI000D69B230|nr:MMPL family transporter [Nocardioides speluncae]
MLSRALYRLGRLAARRPWAVLAAWLVAAVIVVGTSNVAGEELEEQFGAPGLDSQRAADLLEAKGSDQAGPTAQIVLTPQASDATFDRPGAPATALADVRAEAEQLPNVLGASEPSISPDGRVALVRLQYAALDQLSPDDLHNLKELQGDQAGLTVELNGDLFFAFDEAETGIGEMLGLGVAVVLLLWTFGSFVAAGLPLGTALVGLAVGVSALPLLSRLVDIPLWAPQLGAMVGLGIGLDYALFLLTRHRENLAHGLDVEESLARAVATAGRTVVFAGGIVVVAILGLAVSGIPFVTAAGIALSLVVLVMMLASVTLLPALIRLAGRRLQPKRHTDRTQRPANAAWSRWGRHVTRHPWAYALAGTAVLLAMAAPALALRVGMPDEGTFPEHRTERRAYDLVAQGFGPGFNGPLVVAVDTAGDPGVLPPLRAALAADKGVSTVTSPAYDDATGLATIVAYPTTGPQDYATVDTLRRLRADAIPTSLTDSPARAHVGGQTATVVDVGERVRQRLPWLVTAVIVLSALLLVVVFRSVVVPLKAALLNLLGIGASYGVIVMVFQWGWGAGLIGLESTVPIVSFIPMFMFAILFGLSMDYEVFLLSRIREEYDAAGDTVAAVVDGIARTARVITSAAAIMIVVFFGFVFGAHPAIKMFGLGLSTAILIDATIVRMVLVPSLMTLLGRANWWLPAWLARLLPPAAHSSQASPGRAADQPALTG